MANYWSSTSVRLPRRKEFAAWQHVRRYLALRWLGELVEPELNRARLASTIQRNLFAGNAEGWQAYVGALRGEGPWFGVGVPLLKAGEDVRADSTEVDPERVQLNEVAAAGDVERNGGRAEDHRESVESSERIYPSWPWTPGV